MPQAVVMTFALLAVSAWAAEDPRLAVFRGKVDEYAKIRRSVGSKAGTLPNKATPEQIQKHEAALVDEIRKLRPNAKAGDVFTPEVQPLFRELLKQNLSGSANKDSRDSAKQGNPARDKEPGEVTPTVEVNAVYPKSAPLSTVPVLLLLQLPKLPEGIEFRFIGQTLVLWDNTSSLIIDYMKGAAPAL